MSVYGMTLRRRIVAALDSGQSVAATARRFSIDPKTVRSYRRRAAQGRLAPDPSGPRNPIKLTAQDLRMLREQVAAEPGVRLRELRGKLSVDVAESTVCRTLKKLGLSLKKSR